MDAPPDDDLDLVAHTLKLVAVAIPGVQLDVVARIERQIKAQYGGRRYYLPKGAKRLTPAEREAVYRDGLSSLDNDEITRRHKISRSTLYRLMKAPGGRFG